MSPRPREDYVTIHEDEPLNGLGAVEVFTDTRGRVRCIMCLPPTSSIELEKKREEHATGHWASGESDGKEEDVLKFGLLDSISMACVNTCACDYSPSYTKPILKRDDANKSGTTTASMQRRKVSFSKSEIREFDLTLGHHPLASHGPPVMLDYDSQGHNRIVAIDEYEKERGPPRSRRHLKIHPHQRKLILTKGRGFTEAEVNQAWAEAIRIRRQRQETLNRGLLMTVYDDATESMSRKYKRMMGYLGLQ